MAPGTSSGTKTMPSVGRKSFRNPTAGEQRFEAMLYGNVMIPNTVDGEKKIGDECARRLMEKKADAAFDWETVPPRWGNSAGLAQMVDNDTLTDRVGRLEAKDQDKDSRIGAQDATIGVQNARIGVLETENRITKSELRDLKAVTRPYLDVRNRWITNFIKNKARERLTPTDEAIIKTGNSASHHGDPLTDAWVYSENMRDDISTYRDLYGIGPEQVMRNLSEESENNRKALEVLANHATVKADTVIKSVPHSFTQSFRNFVDRLEARGWNTDQLQSELTLEGQLYSNFQVEFDAIKGKLHK